MEKSTKKRALVPDWDYRDYGLHDNSACHERSQVGYLVSSMSIYFVREAKIMLSNVYSAKPNPSAVFCFLSTYCCFCYQITDTELVISDLVFNGHSFQCGFVLALFQLILQIALWDGIGEKNLWLMIKNPIPRTRSDLLRVCTDLQEEGDYLTLNPELVRDICARSQHPKFNRFALTRSDYNQQVQAYEKQLREYPDKLEAYKRMKSEYDALVKTDHGLSAAELDLKKAAYKKARPRALPDEEFSIYLPDLMTKEEEDIFKDSCLSIPDDYVVSLECILHQLYIFVKGWSLGSRNKQTMQCDAVYIDVDCNHKSVCLSVISVRPCLMRMGIATMVLWRLMSACCEFNVPRFRVDTACRNTERLLDKLGGFVYAEGVCEHYITLEHMRGKTLQACGLQDALKEHEEHPQHYLVRSLPAAESLNSQSVVQDRVDAKGGASASERAPEGGMGV